MVFGIKIPFFLTLICHFALSSSFFAALYSCINSRFNFSISRVNLVIVKLYAPNVSLLKSSPNFVAISIPCAINSSLSPSFNSALYLAIKSFLCCFFLFNDFGLFPFPSKAMISKIIDGIAVNDFLIISHRSLVCIICCERESCTFSSGNWAMNSSSREM
eukprot:UN07351